MDNTPEPLQINTSNIPIPPHSDEAEKALLGSVLINPDVVYEIDLEPEDFYIQRHQWAWEAILKLSKKGIVPDLLTLSDELQKNINFIEFGGPAYLTSFISNTPSSMHAKGYASIIRDNAIRRRAITCANRIAQGAFNPATDINEILAKNITDLANSSIINKSSTIHISDVVNELYDEVEERSKNPKEVWGYSSGLADYDRLMGGIQKSEVVYIAGAPGIGKSILAVQMGMNIASHDNAPGIIFSVEMRRLTITRRIVSAFGKVPTRNLKSGNMSEQDWNSFVNACQSVSSLPVYICDQAGLTTAQMRSEVAKLKTKPRGLDWYVLDYLYLMGDKGAKDDNERTQELSRNVREITRQYNLAGITVNSVLKDVMDGSVPTQRSMRGSGEVIHDADVILFITNDKDNPMGDTRKCVFGKVRDEDTHGKTSFKILKLHGGFPAFGNLEVKKNDFVMPDYTQK